MTGVKVKFDGQEFDDGCNGLLLVANHLEGMKGDMTQLTENSDLMRADITDVRLCAQRIEDHLKKNGGSPAHNFSKRQVVVAGGGSIGLMGILANLDQIIPYLKSILAGIL